MELSVRTGEAHGRVLDTEIQATFEAACSHLASTCVRLTND